MQCRSDRTACLFLLTLLVCLLVDRWYDSTSDDSQRRSYELTEGKVKVPVAVLVQEPGLEFARAGMHERILTDASHVAIMSWNFSNVQGMQR